MGAIGGNRINDKKLQKIGVEIALELLRRYYPSEYFVSEEKEITMSNLRNLLSIAREAEEIGSFDLFKIKAAYIARRAERGDSLYYYVTNLIRRIEDRARNEGLSEYEKLRLAEHIVTASIYIYTAITKGMRNLVYPRQRR